MQTKVFFVAIFFLLLMTLNLYENYSIQKKHYNDLVTYTINNTIQKIELNIKRFDAIESIIKQYDDIITNIHKLATKELQENNDIDLYTLQKKLNKQLPINKMFTHIYLIDSNFITKKTTYKEDLGLNLNLISSFKQRVNHLLKNPNEIIIENTAFDIYSGEYNVYSYSLLDPNKKIILKLGYFNSFIGKIKDALYIFQAKDYIVEDVELFERYENYIVNLSKHEKPKNISKQEYLNKLINKKSIENEIINKLSQEKPSYSYYKTQNKRQYKISYTYIKSAPIFKNKYKDYILKTCIDISEFKKNLADLKLLFYLSLVISIMIVTLFLFYLKFSIFKPFNKILQQSNSKEIIEDKKLLNKYNELSELSNNLNAINSELNLSKQEIYEKKEQLKKSNKKLKQFNKNLKQKVDEEVRKNILKDKQLMQHSKLAQMGETINMIAHQWRQPLGSISSAIISTQIKIKSNQYNLDDKQQREDFLAYLDIKHTSINSYIKFLSTTIDDFRNFFRPDNEKELSDINSIIEKTLDMSNIYMKKSNINITYKKVFDANILIYKNQIMQVILNILQNSRENFLLKDIHNPKIEIIIQKEKSYILVSICDNGGGINEDILPNIFEPYFSTKDKKNNTGIGLYMSKIIIEEHNDGKLNVYNNDKGVCFDIYLYFKKKN